MSSFAIPLSGLQASSNALNAISNNLSNLNTDGYKDGIVTFADAFYQLKGTSGNGDPLELGTGVQVSGTSSKFTNGTVNATDVRSNMALQGNGFFVVQDANVTSYTRSGDFSENSSGQLVTPGGALVMGYPATGGIISTTSALSSIQVGQGVTIPGAVTSTFQQNTNLDTKKIADPAAIPGGLAALATAVTNTALLATTADTQSNADAKAAAAALVAYNTANATAVASGLPADAALAALALTASTNANTAAAASLAAATSADSTAAAAATANASATAATFGSPLTVYDSLGTAHNLSIQYTKTGNQTWNYAISVPAADTSKGATGPDITVKSGTMTFDASGKLIIPTGTISGINIPAWADGAAAMNLTWNLNDSAGNSTITQLDSDSTTSSKISNGYGVGTLQDYQILSDGTVEGQFSNSQTLALGRVAVATFANQQGLHRMGGSAYQESFASGTAVVGEAGSGGRGTIAGGSVELSNVDMATEFAKLIVAQQGYSANAKVLTALNQVSQATLQLIA